MGRTTQAAGISSLAEDGVSDKELPGTEANRQSTGSYVF